MKGIAFQQRVKWEASLNVLYVCKKSDKLIYKLRAYYLCLEHLIPMVPILESF